MCVEPGRLPDGTEFACRKCWQCRERRVDDWVGRCLAESKTAVAAHSITLTYGRDDDGAEDHMRSAWLTYSDVQKFFKLLRRDGYKFRYLVAGEYGAMKGRAHWHLLMFWTNKIPPHELSGYAAKRFTNKYWPHGFQHWERPTAASIRYVCKYIQKDIGADERQGALHMSKKPPLGDAYFRDLAAKYVRQGLAPQNLIYRFMDVKDAKGRTKDFYMNGTTARNFIEYYKAEWARSVGGHHPNSTLIEEHDDKTARADYLPEKDRWGWRGVHAPDGGTGPFEGRDPMTGYHCLYSDLFGYRWWYRENEDHRRWQRGEKIEGEKIQPIIRMPGQENPYEKRSR